MGRGGPVERGCGWPSALPHKHIHVSDPCPVPLQLFLIFGPSTPPAMRPQMRCLSLPPAPAPSSYRTMPGGFPRFQPGEWGAGGAGEGWHPRVEEGFRYWVQKLEPQSPWL